MTLEMGLVLAIVVVSLTCFITGALRYDLVALLVLVSLSLSGLVTPAEAIAGFSNPAVITVAGMFVISAALGRTGVGAILGKQIHRISGGGTRRLIAVMMLATGVLAAFMNSAGLMAMMLPVVMDISRRTKTAPSKLLMPLLLGALLGGTTSLVGTVANIVASNSLAERQLAPFGVFDFTPVGSIVLVVGVAFVSLVGWRFLPHRDPHRALAAGVGETAAKNFDLQERLFVVRVPSQSPLDGMSLATSRLGSAAGLHVVAILRPAPEGSHLAPGPATVLRASDRLLVEGRPELLRQLQGNRHLRPQEDARMSERLTSAEIGLAEVSIPPQSSLAGRTLAELNLRNRMKIAVLAIARGGIQTQSALQDTPLQPEDSLLIQGPVAELASLAESADFADYRAVSAAEALSKYRIRERLIALQVTTGSMLIGRTLAENRLADAAGLTIMAIVRDGATIPAPDPKEVLGENDVLLVTANPDDLRVLRAIQKLEIEEDVVPDLSQLESERVGLLEVVLAPRTSLVGRTPRQLHFREKYGLSVLAIWREGKPLRTNLRDVPLEFGDSLLLFGPRAKLRVLASEPDFIGLTESVQAEPRTKLAPVALGVVAIALLPALAGWFPIHVTVLVGAVLAILTRCVTVDEAYRSVDLAALVLVAAMLPLGVALDNTGAARFLAEGMLGAAGQLGPRGILAALCVMTALGSQAIPTSTLVVLMAPIAISAAQNAGMSPHAVMMGVALSASSFASPIGRPGNVLIMGPGGYSYVDFLKLGLPLTVMLLLILIFVMPWFFPLVVA